MSLQKIPLSFRQFGRVLRRARELGGYNISLLAQDCNLSVVEMMGLENGNLVPFKGGVSSMIHTLIRYANKLDIPIPIEIASYGDDQEIVDKTIPYFLRKK